MTEGHCDATIHGWVVATGYDDEKTGDCDSTTVDCDTTTDECDVSYDSSINQSKNIFTNFFLKIS